MSEVHATIAKRCLLLARSILKLEKLSPADLGLLQVVLRTHFEIELPKFVDPKDRDRRVARSIYEWMLKNEVFDDPEKAWKASGMEQEFGA